MTLNHLFNMIKKTILFLLLFLLLPCRLYAQEGEALESFDNKNVTVLNDGLQDTWRRIRNLQDTTSILSTGIVALANGGTGRALTDPGADRILFWDESSNYFDKMLVVDRKST